MNRGAEWWARREVSKAEVASFAARDCRDCYGKGRLVVVKLVKELAGIVLPTPRRVREEAICPCAEGYFLKQAPMRCAMGPLRKLYWLPGCAPDEWPFTLLWHMERAYEEELAIGLELLREAFAGQKGRAAA